MNRRFNWFARLPTLESKIRDANFSMLRLNPSSFTKVTKQNQQLKLITSSKHILACLHLAEALINVYAAFYPEGI